MMIAMSHFKTLTSIWVAVLCVPAIGQSTKPISKTAGESLPSAEQTELEKQAAQDRRRAVALLKGLIEATDSSPDGESKVVLLARIGETLWSYDQQLARHTFEESLKAIESISSEASSPAGSILDVTNRSQLRREVAEVISRLDTAWARKIALGGIEAPDKKLNSKLDFHSIMSLSESDPRYAAEVLRTNLDVQGATLLREVLMKIRRTQPALADEVFNEALSKAEKNLSQPFGFFFEVFGYVFPESDHPEKDEEQYSLSLASTPINEALIRRFLAFGYRAIMQEADEIAKESGTISERSGYGYEYVMSMLPSFVSYMPDEAAKLQARWNAVVGSLQGGQKHIRESDLLRHPPPVESLVRDAETAKRPDEKAKYYSLAAYRALLDGAFERAFSILAKIPDEEDRNRAREDFLSKAAEIALEKGDLENAYRYGKEISEAYDRNEIMEKLLHALLDRKETTRATRILDERVQGVTKDDQLDRARELLSLAEIAVRLNPERGFDISRSAVEALNRARMRDGSPYTAQIADFDRSLLLLARSDFEKALTLAQSLKNENSVYAQIAVCRGILTSPGSAR
ncbi:MAG TPA: hypothetical protein VLM38_12345 [Blastocatellia bacterium]|nr:hypothetical protein [Blastocatellia bacterium]